MKKFEIMIKTELQALNMLARKHSEESELANYIFGVTGRMIKDLEKNKK